MVSLQPFAHLMHQPAVVVVQPFHLCIRTVLQTNLPQNRPARMHSHLSVIAMTADIFSAP